MCDEYRSSGSGGVLFAFLLGGAIGAVLGLLYAPRPGKETRDMLADKSQDYMQQGRDLYDSGMEKATAAYESGRDKVTTAYETGKDKATTAYETGKEKATAASEDLREKFDSAKTVLKERVGQVEGKAQQTLDAVAERISSDDAEATGA